MFIAANAGKFEPSALMAIRGELEKMSDEKIMALTAINYTDPMLILVIAIVLGWERLFLDDVALGILKILTCYGFGIWWLIDIFTAASRAREYNFKKFMSAAAIFR